MKKNEMRGRAALAALAALATCAVVILAALLAAQPARAHGNHTTEVLLVLAADGSWQLSLAADLDALALGASPGGHAHAGEGSEHAEQGLSPAARLRALSPEERKAQAEGLEQYLLRRIRVRFDGTPAVPDLVVFPERAEGTTGGGSVFGGKVMLLGRIPEGAGEVTVQLSRSFPRFRLTVLDQKALGGSVLEVEKGGRSKEYPLAKENPQSGNK